ncbi:unnamed protein product [Owenia fusiformis]|uniref:Tudor domain-containing protein 3 n=1 Tax=Owenia fusiformis TaxID=6347 RepID=A0A8J1TI79_OWEFU|nr:unnamed protein product [Owenia fusiformis]
MADVALKNEGWYLSADGIAECSEDGRTGIQDIIKAALDSDFKLIGGKSLSEGVKSGKESLQGTYVVQVQKVRNVSAPKDNEESNAAPPLLRVTFTDGYTNLNGLVMETISQLGLNTPPGTKLKLTGKIPSVAGFLQLRPANVKVLGGRVDKLVDNWELKRTLAKQTRTVTGSDGGPPPWVEFGKRIAAEHEAPRGRDTFKSLEANKVKKSDGEFEAQRKAQIAEIAKSKDGTGGGKNFGPGTKQDKEIARIMEMGFTLEQATIALRQSNNNVNDAITMLVNPQSFRGGYENQGGHDNQNRGGYDNRGGGYDNRGAGDRYQDRGERPERYQNNRPDRNSSRQNERPPQERERNSYQGKSEERLSRPGENERRDVERRDTDRISDDGRGRGKPIEKSERPDRGGRGRRGRDENEGDDYGPPSKPSAPATLFDFLVKKTNIEVKEDKSDSSSEKGRDEKRPLYNDQSRKPSNLPPRLQHKDIKKEIQLNNEMKERERRPPGPPQSRSMNNYDPRQKAMMDRPQRRSEERQMGGRPRYDQGPPPRGRGGEPGYYRRGERQGGYNDENRGRGRNNTMVISNSHYNNNNQTQNYPPNYSGPHRGYRENYRENTRYENKASEDNRQQNYRDKNSRNPDRGKYQGDTATEETTSQVEPQVTETEQQQQMVATTTQHELNNQQQVPPGQQVTSQMQQMTLDQGEGQSEVTVTQVQQMSTVPAVNQPSSQVQETSMSQEIVMSQNSQTSQVYAQPAYSQEGHPPGFQVQMFQQPQQYPATAGYITQDALQQGQVAYNQGGNQIIYGGQTYQQIQIYNGTPSYPQVPGYPVPQEGAMVATSSGVIDTNGTMQYQSPENGAIQYVQIQPEKNGISISPEEHKAFLKKLQVGDFVSAKYYDDQEFYRATIHQLGPDGVTAFVTYTDYGNTEQIAIEDIHPLTKQDMAQMQVQMQQVYVQPQVSLQTMQPGVTAQYMNVQQSYPGYQQQGASIPAANMAAPNMAAPNMANPNIVPQNVVAGQTIEFRRGGNGQSFQNSRPNDRRINKGQTLYQPGPYKSN